MQRPEEHWLLFSVMGGERGDGAATLHKGFAAVLPSEGRYTGDV